MSNYSFAEAKLIKIIRKGSFVIRIVVKTKFYQIYNQKLRNSKNLSVGKWCNF